MGKEFSGGGIKKSETELKEEIYKVYGLPKFWQHFDPFLHTIIICNHYDVRMVEVRCDDYCLFCKG